MRIVCPSCSAAYEVPDSLLGTPRPVRCARCGDEWTPKVDAMVEPLVAVPLAGTAEPPATYVAPVAPPPVAPPPSEPLANEPLANEPLAVEPLPTEPLSIQPLPAGGSAMERLAAQPSRPPSTLALRLGWAASLLVLVLLGGSAYQWRSEIMRAWPPSARVYAAFGVSSAR